MNRLPQEVLDSIVHYVRKHDNHGYTPSVQSASASIFKSYATLSRTWKEAVESMTLAKLHVSSNDLGRLQMILTPKRRSSIRAIDFRVALPGVPGDTYPDRVAVFRNECITKASHDLLTILAAWEADGWRGSICLRWDVDCTATSSDRRANDTRGLRFLDGFEPPKVSSVRVLNLGGALGRRIVPTVATSLAQALPGLEDID